MTLDFLEEMVHALAKELLPYDEPIPDFRTRFPGKLESCLGAIEQPEYFGNDPVLQLANLVYRIVKNHPFQNGNKRIAMTTYIVVCRFLQDRAIDRILGSPTHSLLSKDVLGPMIEKNGKLAEMFLMIAASDPTKKDAMINLLRHAILIPLWAIVSVFERNHPEIGSATVAGFHSFLQKIS